MAYQSLYRRYRPGKFGELVGQQHVVTALRNAVSDERIGHAYLFSGPRGTGKTSTARILGKALNCTDLGDDGEPCCVCDSCVSFESGTSYDLHELDAASNNGVDAIRELISKVALGSPGRTKVYILDEVHMLTAGAANSLLKTLEEPPEHVVFVLATTEPHKVLPTIRSRTQHYDFELIAASELEDHVRFVIGDAELAVDDSMIDFVLKVGGGSARDTLSALDQVVAAGGVPRDDDAIDQLMEALAKPDSAAVVAGVSVALKAGRDPRVIGESLLDRLREAFLAAMGAPLGHLSGAQTGHAQAIAAEMGPAALTKGLETIGAAVVSMRQAPDPRVDLEVALLRLTRPDLDTDVAALVARIERLERGIGNGSVDDSAPVRDLPPDGLDESPSKSQRGRPADGARAALARQSSGDASATGPARAPSPEPEGSAAVARSEPDSEPQPAPEKPGPRATLGARRGSAKSTPPPADATGGAAQPDIHEQTSAAEPAVTAQASLDLEGVQSAWADVRAQLPGRAKSRFSGGRFISVDGATIVFGLPNSMHRDRCQDCVGDFTQALSNQFGCQVEVRLVVDGDAPPPAPRAAEPAPQNAPQSTEIELEEEAVDVEALTDAKDDAVGGAGLLTDAFPGAEWMESPPGS